MTKLIKVRTNYYRTEDGKYSVRKDKYCGEWIIEEHQANFLYPTISFGRAPTLRSAKELLPLSYKS